MANMNPINYFPNEQGDYTITLYEQPIAIAKREVDAVRIRNSFSALTMRISVLQVMLKEKRLKKLRIK